jgi:hypothetical protein
MPARTRVWFQHNPALPGTRTVDDIIVVLHVLGFEQNIGMRQVYVKAEKTRRKKQKQFLH